MFWSEIDDEPNKNGLLGKPFPSGLRVLPNYQIDYRIPRHIEWPERVENSTIELPPFAHELFREAWRNYFDHPRTAVVMAVASAETAIKSFISDLMPEAAWLIKELISPPIYRIVKSYLPDLPTRNTINGKVLPPYPKTHKVLQKGVELRNDIVHGKKIDQEIDKTWLKDFFFQVRELLYLIDYYAGYDWAFDLLREKTKQSLREQSLSG